MSKIEWSLLIQFLTAVGTISVAVIAIWGDWLRATITPPRLKIFPLNTRGELTEFTNGNRVIYYHLKVVNSRPWAIARNCRVILKGISKELPNGEFQNQPLNSNPSFVWTPAEITPPVINLSREHTFDFGFLVENAKQYTPVLYIVPNNFKGLLNQGKKIRYFLQPTADNYLSEKNQVFEVAWDGKWSDNLDNMMGSLTIREINE